MPDPSRDRHPRSPELGDPVVGNLVSRKRRRQNAISFRSSTRIEVDDGEVLRQLPHHGQDLAVSRMARTSVERGAIFERNGGRHVERKSRAGEVDPDLGRLDVFNAVSQRLYR